jgi:hypothetical protein
VFIILCFRELGTVSSSRPFFPVPVCFDYWPPVGIDLHQCQGAGEAQTFLFYLLTFAEAYLIYHGIINKGEKHMKYLVMVSDLVARQVYVDASSKEEALENANYGKWRLPEDVEHEEVVDRQAVEILEEEGESK